MNLAIDCLDLEHFRSFHNRATLPINRLGPGLHFIRGRNKLDSQLGSNGAGKSSLLGALTWCLYGRTPEGLHNVDVKPWDGAGSPVVSVAVSQRGTKHTVKRSVGKLLLDDRSVGQEQIDDLLGMSYEVFTTAVVMGQGQPLFPDLTPAQKLKLFDAVMNLDRWLRRSKHAASRCVDIGSELNALRNQLATVNGTLQTLAKSIESVNKQIETWEQEQQQQATSLAAKQKWLEQELDALELKRNDADLALDSALTELRALRPQMRGIAEKLHERKFAVSVFVNRMKILNQELKTITTRYRCPTCGQTIRPGRLDDHKEKLHKQVRACKQEIAKEEPEIAELDKQRARLEKAEQDFDRKSDSAQAKLNDINPRIGAMKRELETVQGRLRRESASPWRDQLQELRTRRKQAKLQLAELEKKIRIKVRVLARTEFWIKGFRDVRLHEIEEVLQELELVTNTMVEEVGLVGWQVRYAIERETKSGTVQRGITTAITGPDNREPVKWASWSGGECQRLRIICSLALSEVLLGHAGITTRFEALDEPTQHLSEEGVVDLLDYLSERSRQQQKTILYTDQHTMESSRFSSVVTVVKDKGGSRLAGRFSHGPFLENHAAATG